MKCLRCQVEMVCGIARAVGTMGGSDRDQSNLIFRIPFSNTDNNLIKAFKQGLSGEEKEQEFTVKGYRCPSCGMIELHG